MAAASIPGEGTPCRRAGGGPFFARHPWRERDRPRNQPVPFGTRLRLVSPAAPAATAGLQRPRSHHEPQGPAGRRAGRARPPLISFPVRAQGAITLNGASQFGDDHPYTKAMVRFEELVKQYWGKPINFVLHKNSSLGLEK